MHSSYANQISFLATTIIFLLSLNLRHHHQHKVFFQGEGGLRVSISKEAPHHPPPPPAFGTSDLYTPPAAVWKMKFGKRLQSQIQETIPEWRDKFLSYKQLKKRLKLIAAPDCFTEAAFDASSSPSRGDGGVGICRLPSSAAAAAASAVDAVDQELRRGSEAGGPAAVQEAMLQEARAKKIKRTFAGGLDIEPKKKQQQQLQSKRSGGLLENNEAALMSSEMDFIRLLNNELNKFNVFFIEKEEEYVIRLQELKDRIETVKKEKAAMKGDPSESTGDDELLTILRDIVTFHGEMVLLENYSSLNYTGLVKILKKHDKRTGAVLRMPFIQSVLLQPFFTTELLSKLVRECERNLHSLLPSSLEEVLLSVQGSSTTPESSSPSAQLSTTTNFDRSFNPGEAVETIYRSTIMALRTIQDIRQGSSTCSIFSLPPIKVGEGEKGFQVGMDLRTITPVEVKQ